jgi:hypothetical protein
MKDSGMYGCIRNLKLKKINDLEVYFRARLKTMVGSNSTIGIK